MPRTAAATKAIADAPKPAADRPVSPLTESQAAEIMWVYYRDHKTQLITDIKDYRASILAALMQGAPADQVFAPFVKPLEPTKPLRRAA